MKISPKHLIRKYLYAELSEDEYDQFIKLYNTDTEFAKQVNIESVFYAKRSSKIKDSLLQKCHIAPTKKNETYPVSVLGRYSFITRVAAILAIGVLTYYSISKFNSKQTDSALLSKVELFLSDKHDPPFTVLDNSDIIQDHWTIAKEAIRQEKYSAAINQLEKILQPSTEQSLYLGLSHLYASQGKIDSAIANLELVIKNEGELFKDEANWYLSLAYIQKGHYEQAKSSLEEIVSQKSWNYSKASALLKLLH